MFWLILVIIIVGYFIVNELYKQTQLRQQQTIIAQQQYLNSPEHKNQVKADMAYWRHLNDELDYQTWIIEAEIDLHNTPDSFTGVTYTNGVESKPKTYTKQELIAGRKASLKALKENRADLAKEYEEGKKEYAGYHPQNLETIKIQYDLAVPFDSDYDSETGKGFLNDTMVSSWSMYQDRQHQLSRAQLKLNNLKRGIDQKKIDLKDAVRLVRSENRASTSQLQRKLHISYGEASKLIDEMEKLGVVGPADGARPREVLVKN